MSAVNITYDTETKKASVTIDGKELSNVSGVSMYGDYGEDGDEMYMNVSTMEKDGKTGLVKSTNYYSTASEEAKAIPKKSAIANLPGFVGRDSEEHVVEAMAKFFEQKLRL